MPQPFLLSLLIAAILLLSGCSTTWTLPGRFLDASSSWKEDREKPKAAIASEKEPAKPAKKPADGADGAAQKASDHRTDTPSRAEEMEPLLALLSKNRWFRDTLPGKTSEEQANRPVSDIDPIERQKRERMRRLNDLKDGETLEAWGSTRYVVGSLSPYRWYHPELAVLEEELRGGKDKEANKHGRVVREDLKRIADFWEHANAIVRANAAILAARLLEEERDADPEWQENVSTLLMDAVREETLPLQVRCAAAEMLVRRPETDIRDMVPLFELCREKNTASEKAPEKKQAESVPGLPPLYLELLIGLKQRRLPWEEALFCEALLHRDRDVRRETVRYWQQAAAKRDGGKADVSVPELPPEILMLAADEADPDVLGEVLATLAAWHHPELLRYVQPALKHRFVSVRLAAIDALASCDHEEAVSLLLGARENLAAKVRARAVRSLRILGRYDEVFKAANDKSGEVRVEVARSLADCRTEQSLEIAKQYWNDLVPEVMRTTTEALNGWPLEIVGPMYLDMLERENVLLRINAAQRLAERWPPAAAFPAHAAPSIRREALGKLREQFALRKRDDEHAYSSAATVSEADSASLPRLTAGSATSYLGTGAVDTENSPDSRLIEEVGRILIELNEPRCRGERQTRLLERLENLSGTPAATIRAVERVAQEQGIPVHDVVYDELLSRLSPLFGAIASLETEDVNLRRKAAWELLRILEHQSPGLLGSARIDRLTECEEDTIVLATLCAALRPWSDANTRRFALRRLDHPSAEVRRLACELFTADRSNDHRSDSDSFFRTLQVLERLLQDPASEVVRSALAGLASFPSHAIQRDEAFASLHPAVTRLLRHSAAAVRVDAAFLLHRWGDAAGRDAITRMAASRDNTEQLYLVRRLAAFSGPEFVPEMIRLLDGSGSVRRIALESLPQMAGHDYGTASNGDNGSAARIRRWKKEWAVDN